MAADTATAMRAVKLVLFGYGFDKWPHYDFAEAFPALRHFEAHDSVFDTQFRDIVSTLPRDLKTLRLVKYDFRNRIGFHGSLDDLFPDFDGLESLYLFDGTFNVPPLRAFLNSANLLVSVGFGLNSPVTDDFLRSLVEGPTRLPRLRTLELDYVRCGRGLTMKSQGFKLSKDAEFTPFHEYPGWWEADWPADASQRGLSQIMQAARRGVTLTGSALDTKGWEDDYMAEVYNGLMAWGLEVDNSEEASEFFGDSVVRDFQDIIFSWL